MYLLKNIIAAAFVLLVLVGLYFTLWPSGRKKKDDRPIVYNQQELEDGDDTEDFYNNEKN